MRVTTKAVRGVDPRHNVFIDGRYAGVVRQIYGHADKSGGLHYVYEPTEDSPLAARRSNYSSKRLGMLVLILEHTLRAAHEAYARGERS